MRLFITTSSQRQEMPPSFLKFDWLRSLSLNLFPNQSLTPTHSKSPASSRRNISTNSWPLHFCSALSPRCCVWVFWRGVWSPLVLRHVPDVCLSVWSERLKRTKWNASPGELNLNLLHLATQSLRRRPVFFLFPLSRRADDAQTCRGIISKATKSAAASSTSFSVSTSYSG